MNHRQNRGQCVICRGYPCPDALEVLDNVRNILNVPEGESIIDYTRNLIIEHNQITSENLKELMVMQDNRITELENDLAKAQINYSRLGKIYRNVAMKYEELIHEGRNVTSKAQYLINYLDSIQPLEDGKFTFPDGDTWEKKE